MSAQLATALLSIAETSNHGCFSPSRNPCIVRVSSGRVRNDPYRAVCLVASPKKPVAAKAAAPVAAVRIADVFSAAANAAHSNYHGTANQQQQQQRQSPQPEPITVPNSISCSSDSVFEDVSLCPTTAPSVANSRRSSISAATAPSNNNSMMMMPPSTNERFAVVEFKHELCTYKAPFRVSEGDFVIVEADRGEHAGVVRHVLTEKPQFNVPCRILRRGSPREEEQLSVQASREDATTASIQKMADNIGLAIRIVDTEFYLDGNKLTVFFASKMAVDFRKLQRSLFREFRCRIWLINYAEVQYRNKHFRNRK